MNANKVHINGTKKLAMIICVLMLIAVVLSGCFYHGGSNSSNGAMFPDNTPDDMLVYLKDEYGTDCDFRYTGVTCYNTSEEGGSKYIFDDGKEPSVKFMVTRERGGFTDNYLQRIESSGVERAVVDSFRIERVRSMCYSTVFNGSVDYEGNSIEYGNSSNTHGVDRSGDSGARSCFSYIAVNADQLKAVGKSFIEGMLSDLGRVTNMKHSVWVCLLNERDFSKAEMNYSGCYELNLTQLEEYSSCKSLSYVVSSDGVVTETTNRGNYND